MRLILLLAAGIALLADAVTFNGSHLIGWLFVLWAGFWLLFIVGIFVLALIAGGSPTYKRKW